MPSDPVHETVTIYAPIERCWALSTRIELVQKTLGMTLVGGVTQGSITAGSRVIWSGWKFGLPTRHHTVITRFEPPHRHFLRPCVRIDSHKITRDAFFQDTQEKGRFASFHHDHFFREEVAVQEGAATGPTEVGPREGAGNPFTVLTDEVHFTLPFGFLGELIATRIMQPYIRKLTQQRFAMLKELAEGEGWRAWIDSEDLKASATPQ